MVLAGIISIIGTSTMAGEAKPSATYNISREYFQSFITSTSP